MDKLSDEMLRDMYYADLISDDAYFTECARRGIRP